MLIPTAYASRKPRAAAESTARPAIVAAAILCSALLGIDLPARAALGAAPETAEAGAPAAPAHLQRRIVAMAQYAMNELTLSSGTVVREYTDRNGVVFAVTWRGPVQPNLQQFLGAVHPRVVQAAAAQNTPRARQLVLNQPDLVVEMHGRMRAFSGLAYLPLQLPSGVSAAEIR